MKYVDRYEVEFKLCGLWASTGAIWPKYDWKIVRPWYFLWLVKVPVAADYLSRPTTPCKPPSMRRPSSPVPAIPTPARIWEVKRRGTKYVSAELVWEIS